MKRAFMIGGALLTCWLTIAAAAMLPGSIQTAMVPAGTQLPETVAILDHRGPLLIIHSEDPGYVRALYAGGAAFVLPARKKTCVDLQNV
ncbi:MAG: hypothetical protein OXC60_20860 [Litoreibacter sp.]|nr:hypothetical protein [Litoreibacter sp.]